MNNYARLFRDLGFISLDGNLQYDKTSNGISRSLRRPCLREKLPERKLGNISLYSPFRAPSHHLSDEPLNFLLLSFLNDIPDHVRLLIQEGMGKLAVLLG